MRHFRRSAVSIAAAHVALCWSSAALAQASSAAAPAAPAAPASAASPALAASSAAGSTTQVVVTGQRAALQTAQKLKQNADEVVDSIVAEDIGKLPDRSVTEVLQRVVGVAMDRTAARQDPVHYSVEGSGVVIRGLTYVTSQLNGRETFSANGGRSLSFEDVPPELMAGVDVYKNPSAEQLEGAISGLVNLRTAMPFDHTGFKSSISLSSTRNVLRGNQRPSISGLVSDTWDTDLGKFGALLDLAHSESSTRSDSMAIDPYYLATTKSTVNGTDYFTPKDGTWIARDIGWRQQQYDRTRDGAYAALQWKKGDVESALTFFRSKYKFAWNENAVSAQVDPYSITVTDGVYAPDGRMLKGVLRNDAQGGIEVETGTRYASRDSRTQELTWNTAWKPNDRWTLSTDLQYISSRTSSFDSSVSTGTTMPKETIDLTGSMPRVDFDASDVAYMADPSHYYWATTMEHFDKGRATQKAWRADAKYSFNDDPHLYDLRFGVRIAERDALTTNSNPSYNWATITHNWQKGWNVNDLAWINNYNDPTVLNKFSNFMGGKVSMPAMYFPAASVAFGYPASYTSLHQHYLDICKATHYDWYQPGQTGCDQFLSTQGTNWALATFDTDPAGRNEQHERTMSAYSQLRFGFEELPYPVDGNVGLRLVHTSEHANGYTVLTAASAPASATGLEVPPMGSRSWAQTFNHEFNDLLPSLNLRMKAGKDLQYRFALSRGLTRPALDQMQAYTTLTRSVAVTQDTPPVVTGVSQTGTASGNPMLKPVTSNNQDATAEWYFNRSGSVTLAAFNKNLSDIIINQTMTKQVADDNGVLHDFVVTGPINGAKGFARGFELAYHQYFDMLPGLLSGIGLEANWTFVNSKMKRYNAVYSDYCTAGANPDNLNLFANGCDTDGRSFADVPLPNLSRNTINLALLYDKGPVSARVAYSWRERYLYGVALNSDATGPNQTNGLDTNPDSATYGRNNLPIGLPLWGDSYGQLDAGVHYKVDDNMTLSLEGQNLTNSMYRQLMQQHLGMLKHNFFTSGRIYTVSMRYTF